MTALQTFSTEAFITRPPAGRLSSACSPVGSHDHTVRVRVVGELDRATAPELTQGIAAASRGRDALSSWATHPAIGLDLHQLTFCDLGGVNAISEARADLLTRGFRLCLTRPTRPVLRLLDLAIFHGWLPPDLECAQLPWQLLSAADAGRQPSTRRSGQVEITHPRPLPGQAQRVVQQHVGDAATTPLLPSPLDAA